MTTGPISERVLAAIHEFVSINDEQPIRIRLRKSTLKALAKEWGAEKPPAGWDGCMLLGMPIVIDKTLAKGVVGLDSQAAPGWRVTFLPPVTLGES